MSESMILVAGGSFLLGVAVGLIDWAGFWRRDQEPNDDLRWDEDRRDA